MLYIILGTLISFCGVGCFSLQIIFWPESCLLIILGVFLIILGLFLIAIRGFIGKFHVIPNRTVFKRNLDDNVDEVDSFLHDIFLELDFKEAKYGKEDVFLLGGSFFKVRMYAKYTIVDYELTVEAWLSAGIGSWPNTEVPMDDLLGGLNDEDLEFRMEEVIERLDRFLLEAQVIEE